MAKYLQSMPITNAGQSRELYAAGNELVRTILNKAFFTKLMIEGDKIVSGELKEPFNDLVDGDRRVQKRRYYRTLGSSEIGLAEAADAELERRYREWKGGGVLRANESPALLNGALREVSIPELLELSLTLLGQGSSKPVVVGGEGIEPSRA